MFRGFGVGGLGFRAAAERVSLFGDSLHAFGLGASNRLQIIPGK